MNVKIEIIPHNQQRYPTVGDWFFAPILACSNCGLETRIGGELPPPLVCPVCQKPHEKSKIEEGLVIRVSKLSDWRYEMLVAIHELAEVLMCKHDGVSQELVDAFDKDFEAKRTEDNEDEPGDEPDAPYVKQHCLATGIERIMAAHLGVSWKNYEAELGELP